MKHTLRLLACAALAATAAAHAEVVSFESDDFDVVFDDGGIRTVDGFDFTLQSGNSDAFFVSGLFAPSDYVNSGSKNLYAANDASLGIAESTGASFDLNSFDLGGGLIRDRESWASSVAVVGRVAGGGTLVASFALPSDPVMTTVTLGWNNLTSFELMPNAPAGSMLNERDYTIDNIDVSVAVIPEPATYALMLGGLAAVAWSAKRRTA